MSRTKQNTLKNSTTFTRIATRAVLIRANRCYPWFIFGSIWNGPGELNLKGCAVLKGAFFRVKDASLHTALIALNRIFVVRPSSCLRRAADADDGKRRQGRFLQDVRLMPVAVNP